MKCTPPRLASPRRRRGAAFKIGSGPLSRSAPTGSFQTLLPSGFFGRNFRCVRSFNSLDVKSNRRALSPRWLTRQKRGVAASCRVFSAFTGPPRELTVADETLPGSQSEGKNI